jgi:hypothetical protein
MRVSEPSQRRTTKIVPKRARSRGFRITTSDPRQLNHQQSTQTGLEQRLGLTRHACVHGHVKLRLAQPTITQPRQHDQSRQKLEVRLQTLALQQLRVHGTIQNRSKSCSQLHGDIRPRRRSLIHAEIGDHPAVTHTLSSNEPPPPRRKVAFSQVVTEPLSTILERQSAEMR